MVKEVEASWLKGKTVESLGFGNGYWFAYTAKNYEKGHCWRVATSAEIPAADEARFYRGDFRSMDHYKQVKAREANASPQARRDDERLPNQILDLTPEQIRAAAIHYEPRQTND